MEYTTTHKPKLNRVIERIFTIIKEGELDILMNVKLNDRYQKMIWAEAIHTCEHVRKIMDTTVSTKIPFETFYGDKPKIIGLFSEFGCITYVTKWDKCDKKMTEKMYKAIMVGYAENQTRDTYKLYNTDTNRLIMTRYINWGD